MTKRSLTSQTLIVTFGRSIEKITILLLTIILSRYLTKFDYGTYRQFLLISSTLTLMFAIGLPASINYFIPRLDTNKQKMFISQTILVLILLGLILGLFLIIGKSYISALFNNQKIESLIILLALFSFLSLPITIYHNFFISINKAKLTGLLSIIFGLLKFIFMLVPVILGLSLNYIIISLVLFTFFQFIVIIFNVVNSYDNFRIKFSNSLLREQLHFALPLGMAAIVGILIRKTDQIMVSSFFPPDQYAIYANGAMEIPFLTILTSSAMAVLTPFLVKSYNDGNKKAFVDKWNNSLAKISLIIFPITIFLMFFSKEAMIVLFSRKYAESSSIFRIYLLIEFCRITIFGNILLALGKSKLIFLYTVVTFFLNIILNFIFIKTLGLIGPVIATVLSVYFMNFLQLRKISAILRIKVKNIWPWKKLIVLAVSVCIFASITYTIKFLQRDDIFNLFIGGSFFSIIYLIYILKFYKEYIPNFKIR